MGHEDASWPRVLQHRLLLRCCLRNLQVQSHRQECVCLQRCMSAYAFCINSILIITSVSLLAFSLALLGFLGLLGNLLDNMAFGSGTMDYLHFEPVLVTIQRGEGLLVTVVSREEVQSHCHKRASFYLAVADASSAFRLIEAVRLALMEHADDSWIAGAIAFHLLEFHELQIGQLKISDRFSTKKQVMRQKKCKRVSERILVALLVPVDQFAADVAYLLDSCVFTCNRFDRSINIVVAILFRFTLANDLENVGDQLGARRRLIVSAYMMLISPQVGYCTDINVAGAVGELLSAFVVDD
ncbi:hypothetical protein FB192DRAFT_1023308 [Mucor lusitanicus]|uniref:Uncharacterized protein n=1 Tax=Mucor circinelloides f. lusitanicus TaxID=29924 RepID=A0A8H4BRX3_MUCCL|nr:hypothetical protein FB192DRAFT_1023308 [Mucor lusitanicus]